MLTTEQALLETAERIAIEAHAGQFRRDGITPYIDHPKAVASRLQDDTDAQVVAWLHDVIEDTDRTRNDLESAGIPSRLVEVVVLLTKDRNLSYEDNLFRVASHGLAKKVKIADMLSNLSDNPTPLQIRKYAKGLLFLTEDEA